MSYKELKFKGSKIVKNKPKPPSKHIQTADLGTAIQFLSDNLNNIMYGAAAFNVGALGATRYGINKIRNRFKAEDAKPK